MQARRSLARPSEPTTSATKTAKSSAIPKIARRRVEWPSSVRMYVQRSFIPENQVKEVPREEMENKLKSVITQAAENDKLEKIDWDSLPLPQILILNDRNNSLAKAKEVKRDIDSTSDNTSKKRKSTSTELKDELDGKHGLPRSSETNNYETPGDKRRRADDLSSKSKSEETNLEMRRRRFEKPSGYGSSPPPRDNSPVANANTDQGAIVGRCQNLEKNYFRLTSAPNPDHVRPLPVLMKTLDLLKKKWKQDNNYLYICDQFKSLRQDLTVQHIRNQFTVSVYEIHARIALEKGDLGEYNQCQTQLRALYAHHLGGHPSEFKAYRILYFIHTRNLTAMNDALADLTPTDKRDPAVRHALDVRSALALGNYHRFFHLYLDTPNMGAYLMDKFVDRERLSGLAAICKA